MHSLAPIIPRSLHICTPRCSHMHIYIYSACLQAYYTQERSTQQQGGGGRGVAHYRHGTNENDHDLRSLRLSAAARSIVGVKTNFRDRNRGGQNRRSSERRDSIAMPARGSREPDAQIRCLAARHACYGPACYGSAETSLTGILCHPVGAILRPHDRERKRPVVDDPRNIGFSLNQENTNNTKSFAESAKSGS